MRHPHAERFLAEGQFPHAEWYPRADWFLAAGRFPHAGRSPPAERFLPAGWFPHAGRSPPAGRFLPAGRFRHAERSVSALQMYGLRPPRRTLAAHGPRPNQTAPAPDRPRRSGPGPPAACHAPLRGARSRAGQSRAHQPGHLQHRTARAPCPTQQRRPKVHRPPRERHQPRRPTAHRPPRETHQPSQRHQPTRELHQRRQPTVHRPTHETRYRPRRVTRQCRPTRTRRLREFRRPFRASHRPRP